ncbi:UNKNOWN [Stylonychia lemnae]|uniref:Leucine Rich Repeat family protein n=1 Tax=Stylonychia lemnae TaxID=5949 RepID=A0A078AZ42_STYLE|nr:UNKNOWN [Stylonychia lemnae]|eukprot:CDW87404.1 UNKNOWN [Stylonychia lemnae]
MEKSKSHNYLPFTKRRQSRYQNDISTTISQTKLLQQSIDSDQKSRNKGNNNPFKIDNTYTNNNTFFNDKSIYYKSTYKNQGVQGGNQNSVNMLSEFQKNIISIASQINRLNFALGNEATENNRTTNDIKLDSSAMNSAFKVSHSRAEFTPLKLPSIKNQNNKSQLFDVSANVQTTLLNNEQRQLIEAKNIKALFKKPRKQRHEKDYHQKNNPLLCRCKDHLSKVNEMNQYINSLTEDQNEGEACIHQKGEEINKSDNNLKQQFFSPKYDNNAFIQQTISPSLNQSPKRLINGNESKQTQSQLQLRDLLRDKFKKNIDQSKSLSQFKEKQSIDKNIQAKRVPSSLNINIIVNRQAQKHLLDSDTTTTKHSQPSRNSQYEQEAKQSMAQSTKSSALIMQLQLTQSIQNEGYDEKYDDLSPKIRESLLWQEENVLKNEQQVEKFYDNYKKIEKIAEVDQNNPRQNLKDKNPIIEYLNYNLKSFHVNLNFAKAFSENLKSNSKLTSLTLIRTNLNDQSFSCLMTNLPLKLQKLDVSGNSQLTVKSYSILKQFLCDNKRVISNLNFEGNLMGDECCKEICSGIVQSLHLKILNLSKNNLTDVGAQYISEVLSFEGNLMTSLLLHWNKIRSKGAILLAKALRSNYTLQIFDASFNSFGTGHHKEIKQGKLSQYLDENKIQQSSKKDNKLPLDSARILQSQYEPYTNAAWKFMKAFASNKRLAHVDLSFNSFKREDIKIIGEGLKNNHTILGIHMLGNDAEVNQLGFVDGFKKEDNHLMGHVFTRIPAHLKTHHIVSKNLIDLKVSSNCWVCEGWSQMEFRIIPIDVKQPYLHLSFENYMPQKMDQDPSLPGQYLVYRMVPPGSLGYFYSNEENVTYVDPVIPSINNDKSRIQNENINIYVPKINYVENAENLAKYLSSDDLLSFKAVPRPEPNKIDKMIKSVKDKENIYKYLKGNYRYIREAYRYFSAVNPSGLVFSIGTNVFSDIIYNCPSMLDSKLLKLSDVDLEFISTKAGNQFRGRMNPDRQLIRFQFLEIFVRLAIDKYYKTKQCIAQEDAIYRMFDEHVMPYFKNFNSNDFKWAKLWNEQCDIIIKANLKVLQDIYYKYYGKDSLPGELKFMSMNEFIDLVTRSGVIDDNFGAREIGIIFNLSMMTQVDEINKERHTQMQFIEFVEALSRVAERVMIPIPSFYDNDELKSSIESPTLRERQFAQSSLKEKQQSLTPLHKSLNVQGNKEYPLEKKFQDYINRICALCMGEEYAYNYKRKIERQETLRKKRESSLAQQPSLMNKTGITFYERKDQNQIRSNNGSFIGGRNSSIESSKTPSALNKMISGMQLKLKVRDNL